jgi:hypothetical protein
MIGDVTGKFRARAFDFYPLVLYAVNKNSFGREAGGKLSRPGMAD